MVARRAAISFCTADSVSSSAFARRSSTTSASSARCRAARSSADRSRASCADPCRTRAVDPPAGSEPPSAHVLPFFFFLPFGLLFARCPMRIGVWAVRLRTRYSRHCVVRSASMVCHEVLAGSCTARMTPLAGRASLLISDIWLLLEYEGF